MKTSNRIPKAIAVIVILGLGLVHNIEKKHFVINSTGQLMSNRDETQVDSDTLKSSENKLIDYTKSFIQKSIQQFISTI